MNTDTTIIDEIDPEIVDRLTTSRRGLFVNAAMALGGLASAPLLLAATSQEAFAQGLPRKIVDTLNFALTLEYLESDFYRAGLSARGLIPGKFRDVFRQISKHEDAHVKFLQGALGSQAVAKPQFDFTAGGKYPDALSNFDTFALLSQTFEDLGVGAYKGQATNLMASDQILTAALQIHSVEARHAAEVRTVRNVLPWDGAFDEPVSKAKVLAAAGPFLA